MSIDKRLKMLIILFIGFYKGYVVVRATFKEYHNKNNFVNSKELFCV